MEMSSRIRARRKELNITQQVLANLVGVSRVTVTGWESGDYQPGGANLQALAAALQCRPAWLVDGKGEAMADSPAPLPTARFGIKEIPVLSWVQAGIWTESEKPVTLDDARDWIYTTASVSEFAFALKVRGDSMTNPHGAPSIPDGSVVVVDPDFGGRDEANGKIVVAQLEGSNEATLKKFTTDGPFKYLVPLNPSYKMLEVNGNCRIIGVVKQIIMDL
ncbi:LexA family protein [Acerihabitans arboris]|uniref:Helix-turn-helix domain-containing protein n=1 Tax=Acerihabitans arboris TaxID=2691583 RepID=A0A845SPR1_9GAMM|nr:S24 family peptidase [Acerihabitans arboris]NDL64934.1 helix-turn-helix domain-containing protein [Acerihabitans arboris]